MFLLVLSSALSNHCHVWLVRHFEGIMWYTQWWCLSVSKIGAHCYSCEMQLKKGYILCTAPPPSVNIFPYIKVHRVYPFLSRISHVTIFTKIFLFGDLMWLFVTFGQNPFKVLLLSTEKKHLKSWTHHFHPEISILESCHRHYMFIHNYRCYFLDNISYIIIHKWISRFWVPYQYHAINSWQDDKLSCKSRFK